MRGLQKIAVKIDPTQQSVLTAGTTTRIKHIFVCKVGDEQNGFEVDLGAGNDAVNQLKKQFKQKVHETERWLSERAQVSGKICIRGITYYLAGKENAAVTSWSIDYASHEEYKEGDTKNCQSSHYAVEGSSQERIVDIFRSYTQSISLPFSTQIQTVDDCFRLKPAG